MTQPLPCFCLRGSLGILLLTAAVVMADDWSQWRGSQHGFAEGPALIDELPADGLKPVWIQTEDIPAAEGGGWSSPVVHQGKLFLFAHKKKRLSNDRLPPVKYPYLAPEKRVGMSDEEYREYEANRRDEQETRSRQFRFDEVLYCLDANTGDKNWEVSVKSVYTRFPQSGTPCIVGDRLFVMGAGRTARCFDIKDKKQVWETRLPGEFRDEFLQSSFLVTPEVATVVCGSLFGLDPNSGTIRWQHESRDNRVSHSSPVEWSHQGRRFVIANLGAGETICTDEAGKELWRHRTEGGHSTPIVMGDRLITYGNSRKKGLRCFELSLTGVKDLWVFQGAADPGSTPVVVGNYVYVQGQRRLAAVDLADGKAEWSTTLKLGNPRYTSLVAADDKVFYAFEGMLIFRAGAERYEQVVQANIDRGGTIASEKQFRSILGMAELEKTAEGQKQADRLWRTRFKNSGPLACATPAIVDGRIYLRLKNGMACYDLRR